MKECGFTFIGEKVTLLDPGPVKIRFCFVCKANEGQSCNVDKVTL